MISSRRYRPSLRRAKANIHGMPILSFFLSTSSGLPLCTRFLGAMFRSSIALLLFAFAFPPASGCIGITDVDPKRSIFAEHPANLTKYLHQIFDVLFRGLFPSNLTV